MYVAESPLPTPGSEDLLIKVAAAGVNRPDVLQRMGAYPAPKGHSSILGLEVAGEVVAVGAGARAVHSDVQWKAGDRVCGLANGGGYAEFVAIPAAQCLPVPAGLSDAQAACVPETFFTVWANLRQIWEYQEFPTSMLVHGGASGIGTTAIQLAKAFGMRVYATVGSDDKAQRLQGDPYLRCARAINYRTEDFEAVLREEAPGGVDAVLDIVAGSGYLQKNINVLAPGGRLAIIGALGGIKTEMNVLSLMNKQLTVTGAMLRPRSTAFKGQVARELFDEVWPLLERPADRRGVQVVMDSQFALADVAAAHARMQTSLHVGKIALVM